jgi:AGCS family alanine or glycine:cation symporter
VCTITALVISVTGVLGMVGANGQVLNGVALVIQAFRSVIPGGEFIVILGVILFGYTTIIGWAYYGEKSMEFLCGESLQKSYRVLFCFCVFLGSIMSLEVVWPLADIMNGLMTFPNLIGLLGLSSIACKESEQFFKLLKQEKKVIFSMKR